MAELIAVSVGNTRTRFGLFIDGQLDRSSAVVNTEVGGGSLAEFPRGAPVVMASVNPPVSDRLASELASAGWEVARFGKDLAIPIENALEDDSTVGQDRLLNALGAHARAGQACVVIDAGTAITVDFVDGEGVFQGGAIAPGLNMMLRSLHEWTAALPEVVYEPVPAVGPEASEQGPPAWAFGKDTRRAMLLGVQSAAQGMARALVERYATAFGAYPQIVATGGDARALFAGEGGDELVEHIVPDLTLLGIQSAVQRLADEP